MSPGEVTRDFYRRQGALAEQQRVLKILRSMEIGVCNCYECEAIRKAIEKIEGTE